jgi:hypothetical protein
LEICDESVLNAQRYSDSGHYFPGRTINRGLEAIPVVRDAAEMVVDLSNISTQANQTHKRRALRKWRIEMVVAPE